MSLAIGTEVEELVIDAVDPGRMKTMALLLRDPNPIHWDTEVVSSLGLGDRVINQGPINVGYLMQLAARAAGGMENVRRFAVRFSGNVLSGDRVVCSGAVTAVDDLAGTAELALEARVGERVVLSGTATVVNS